MRQNSVGGSRPKWPTKVTISSDLTEFILFVRIPGYFPEIGDIHRIPGRFQAQEDKLEIPGFFPFSRQRGNHEENYNTTF